MVYIYVLRYTINHTVESGTVWYFTFYNHSEHRKTNFQCLRFCKMAKRICLPPVSVDFTHGDIKWISDYAENNFRTLIPSKFYSENFCYQWLIQYSWEIEGYGQLTICTIGSRYIRIRKYTLEQHISNHEEYEIDHGEQNDSELNFK